MLKYINGSVETYDSCLVHNGVTDIFRKHGHLKRNMSWTFLYLYIHADMNSTISKDDVLNDAPGGKYHPRKSVAMDLDNLVKYGYIAIWEKDPVRYRVPCFVEIEKYTETKTDKTIVEFFAEDWAMQAISGVPPTPAYVAVGETIPA
jgi:hypothetical protein